MLNAGPRGQFPRWRRSRKRLSVCSVLRCPDLWLQSTQKALYIYIDTQGEKSKSICPNWNNDVSQLLANFHSTFLLSRLAALCLGFKSEVCCLQSPVLMSKVHSRSPAISALSELQPICRLKCLKTQFCKLQSLGLLDYKYDVYRPDQTSASISECTTSTAVFWS